MRYDTIRYDTIRYDVMRRDAISWFLLDREDRPSRHHRLRRRRRLLPCPACLPFQAYLPSPPFRAYRHPWRPFASSRLPCPFLRLLPCPAFRPYPVAYPAYLPYPVASHPCPWLRPCCSCQSLPPPRLR